MESNNAPGGIGADPAVEAACRFSRYARRMLDAEPQLASDSGTGRPFTAEEMAALLRAEPIPDESTLQRALRRLRKQVMLRLIARDIGGRAGLPEVLATVTALAENTIS